MPGTGKCTANMCYYYCLITKIAISVLLKYFLAKFLVIFHCQLMFVALCLALVQPFIEK